MKEHTQRMNITLRPEQRRKLEQLQRHHGDLSQSATLRRLIENEIRRLKYEKSD